MANNGQSRTARRQQKKSKKKPIWKKILLSALLLFIVVGIGVAGLFIYYVATAPEIDTSQLADPFSSKVYDKDGELIADLGQYKRTKITIDDLPQVLIDAVTATEDVRFFEHPGIDLRRIGGAIIGNIRNGFGSEGASTITQQLVEKSFLSHEKKLKLKVQEQWLALKLEREFEKDEILEMYLNKIFYGANAYGVAKAAETYFGKTDLHELTLPEAAILAGLPQRPTAYNPFNNPDATKARMKTVLQLMVRHEKISQEEMDEALEVDITSLLVENRPETTPYDAFITQVEKEVKEKLDGANIYTDGLEIHTTLDKNAQDYVELLLSDSENNPITFPNEDLHAGLVVLDTETGAIRAIGGDRNYQNGFNYAIQGGSQPGSAFKPIVAYGPAIEYNKISTYHQINDDKPFEITGSEGKAVRNWNRKYQGWMTARHALVESLNVPTVKLFLEVGAENARKFGNNLGIEFPLGNPQLTDAIGGHQTEVNPLQLASAYQPFGKEGIRYEPYAVTKVVFPDETVELASEPELAMSDYTAYMVSDMLKQALAQGSSGGPARIPGLPVAAKTGTTNLEDVEGALDSWIAGYTTKYTTAIWVGYDESKRTMDQEKWMAHTIFKQLMTKLHENIDTPDFVKPDSVVEVEVEKGTNPAALPSEYTPKDEIIRELFVKGTEPKKVSEKYDQIDPVKNLKAKYNEEKGSILATWDYESENEVGFEISASINGGEMKVLSTIEDTEMEISEISPGAEYTIQVVVFNKENEESRSEPKTVTVNVEEEEEDEPEDENEEENSSINAVSGLTAIYNAEQSVIDVSWAYNGPPAQFEVIVEGPQGGTDVIRSQSIEISGNFNPGDVYTIHVTATGQRGANNGVRSETVTTTIEIPQEESDETNADPDPGEDEES
ncbi:PBP1A family penicillin-binding protein [Ornithinibacillus halotolerans]|uniref:Penicillin-binding protein 1A/1B n=1 Tax=Ornithinibacillus halotolerans TaxID=1274357 RepID=A0A916W2R3_9BACI|nr:PBP1A family penicillin-binding protein [Ornithinibacillus halotolerans]GGA61543.1 penicillin-binding protein 1A/1B [Ornithinibacillus halotolerans]